MDSEDSDVEYDDSAEANSEQVAGQVAVTCMQRFTEGLYSGLIQDQSDALGVYEWLPVIWKKNYKIYYNWKQQLHDKKQSIVTRVVHILCTTKDAKLQLKAVKCLSFLAGEDSITDIMISTGGLYVVLSMLLHGDGGMFSDSLHLMKQCSKSGTYGDEKTVLILIGLVDVLCCAFLGSPDKERVEKIMELLFNFFRRFRDNAPKLEVTKVCSALNQMLHQTEGTLGDPEVQAMCLQRAQWNDITPYWRSFVDSGLVLTLTNGLEKWKGSAVHEQALSILCSMGGEEAAAKVMLDAGILQALYKKEPKEIQESEMLMIGNMLITSVEMRDRCIKEGVVDFVLKFMEGVDPCGDMENSVVFALGCVFHPNPKGVPKKYAEYIIPVLQRGINSNKSYVQHTALDALLGVTATYEGDEFENVDRLMECGMVSQIADILADNEPRTVGAALVVVTSLVYSKKTPVVKALVDGCVLSSALSFMRSSSNYHFADCELVVAKLVMGLTLAGFGKECVKEQARSLHVLQKNLWNKNRKRCGDTEDLTPNYTEADLIDFGEKIAETRDLQQIRKLLDMDHFSVYLFIHYEDDPLLDRKLNAMVKIVDHIREMGIQRIYCFYHYILNAQLERVKLEDTKTKLAYILECLCSSAEEEEGKISTTGSSPTPSFSSSDDWD